MDRQTSLGAVYSVLAWVGVFAFILAGTVVGLTVDGERGLAVSLALCAHGLALSAGAATLTIRGMLQQQDRIIRDAYELGRETSPVRRMR